MKKKVIKSPASALIAKNATKKNRRKVSLYLSGDLYDKFVSECEKGDAIPSRVMEDMIEEFLESLKQESR